MGENLWPTPNGLTFDMLFPCIEPFLPAIIEIIGQSLSPEVAARLEKEFQRIIAEQLGMKNDLIN